MRQSERLREERGEFNLGAMPQMQLPIFPSEMTFITEELGFQQQDGVVFYFHGHLPTFRHGVKDLATFRMYIAGLVINGTASQRQIAEAFGISAMLVQRAVKRLKEKGPGDFYARRRGRGPTVLTEEKLQQAQGLLDQGQGRRQVAESLGLKKDCVRKAIAVGRLHQRKEPSQPPPEPSHKSQRAEVDAVAPHGMGATRTVERQGASLGLLREALPQFQGVVDVPNGGVLLALPTLLANGLLQHTSEHFALPKGFYGLASVFLLVGFLALARVKSLEKLRHLPPGEWGKLLGLDRIPEVRTLRQKLGHLAQSGQVEKWAQELSGQWMKDDESLAGVLYVDGHVRVYHGEQTALPRRYVARERLCLRGTTDYWVNDRLGQPFFVVSAPVNPGLVAMLREQIVPRLSREVPGQPSAEQLQAQRWRARFLVVFDREGYSPELFQELWEQRIACLTYRKKPGADWPVEEFQKVEVQLNNGEVTIMELAERGVYLGSLWMREIRKRSAQGQQTAVVGTDYQSAMRVLAPTMFGRWSQENFLKYMREHFGLDRLIEYGTDELPEITRVVNPAHRELESGIKKQAALLVRRRAEFGALSLEEPIQPEIVEKYSQRKAQLLESLTELEDHLAELKIKRKATPRHVLLKELPAEQQFRRLAPYKKQLVDTIKMIAYRAETALAWMLAPDLARPAEARSVLQGIFADHVDLEPNEPDGSLTVKLHPLANTSNQAAIQKLCDCLNQTETQFPGTNLRMIYQFGSKKFPRDQEI